MKKSIFWNWIPLISIGPLKFGQHKCFLIDKYQLIRTPDCDPPSWETYDFPDGDTSLSFEESYLVSVNRYESFFYQEKNLIGLSLEEICAILGPEDEIGETIILENDNLEKIGEIIPVEYNELGLQLWFENGVVTNTCSDGITEDD